METRAGWIITIIFLLSFSLHPCFDKILPKSRASCLIALAIRQHTPAEVDARHSSLLISLRQDPAGPRIDDVMRSAAFQVPIAQFVIDVPAVWFQDQLNAVDRKIA